MSKPKRPSERSERRGGRSPRRPPARGGRAPRRPDEGPRDAGEAVEALLVEVALLDHHVAAATRMLADTDDLTHGQVSVLRSLAGDGPATVPALARQRAVARQPVQRMVDELASLGLVRLVPNPRHKRSRLVTLTTVGRRRLAAMERRRSAWIRPVAAGLSPRTIAAATRVVRRIRERIAARDATPTDAGPRARVRARNARKKRGDRS